MKRPVGLTAEQHERLDQHVAGIGHNQGPTLVAHADDILANVAKHHHLRSEATRIRVLLDMLRSHLAGEHLLPTGTAVYVAAGVALVAAITGVGIAATPVAALLLDAPVALTIIAALGGEMEEYVDWRAAHDPSYQLIKGELYPGPDTR
jgi:hypothetical protein